MSPAAVANDNAGGIPVSLPPPASRPRLRLVADLRRLPPPARDRALRLPGTLVEAQGHPSHQPPPAPRTYHFIN